MWHRKWHGAKFPHILYVHPVETLAHTYSL